MSETNQIVVAAIPAAVSALAEILKLIATLKAHSGLTDEEMQAMVDAKLSENEKNILILLGL